MNKVILKGRITQDLELRTTINNKSVVRFTLAVNEGYGDNKRTNFINCEVWNGKAENLAKYCEKGSLLLLEGRIRVESYDDPEGNRRYIIKVVAENIEFLGSKKGSVENTAESTENAAEEKEDPFADFGEEIELSDEDLPF